MNKPISAREAALKGLYRIDVEEGYSNIVLDDILSNFEVNDIDKPLITEIVYGVVSRKLSLDYIINKNSKVKSNKISPWIRNIMRMGIYQILYLTKIPVSAACNESVKLARKYGHQASAGFVNAILRKVADSGEGIFELANMSDIERISILHSHPEWVVRRWVGQYGSEFTQDLCRSNNERPKIVIRANTLLISRENLIEMFNEKGIKVSESKISKNGLIFQQGNPINELFHKGMYTVQDEAAMLVSEVLDPKPGEMVADICSAPGGKTTHIAQLMENRGKIYAWDIHRHRVELVEKAAQRLGVNIIETRLQDAAQLNETLIGKCDKVLIDAPCSGLGVIRRKPEIKWTRTEEDLDTLAGLQRKILAAASNYVKNGGRMVYSTCTLNEDENEKVVEEFINKNKNFEIETVEKKKYDILSNKEVNDYLNLYPNIHGTDGFFIASLKRL